MWLERPEHAPAALEILTARGDAVSFAATIAPAAATELAARVAGAFAAPALRAAITGTRRAAGGRSHAGARTRRSTLPGAAIGVSVRGGVAATGAATDARHAPDVAARGRRRTDSCLRREGAAVARGGGTAALAQSAAAPALSRRSTRRRSRHPRRPPVPSPPSAPPTSRTRRRGHAPAQVFPSPALTRRRPLAPDRSRPGFGSSRRCRMRQGPGRYRPSQDHLLRSCPGWSRFHVRSIGRRRRRAAPEPGRPAASMRGADEGRARIARRLAPATGRARTDLARDAPARRGPAARAPSRGARARARTTRRSARRRHRHEARRPLLPGQPRSLSRPVLRLHTPARARARAQPVGARRAARRVAARPGGRRTLSGTCWPNWPAAGAASRPGAGSRPRGDGGYRRRGSSHSRRTGPWRWSAAGGMLRIVHPAGFTVVAVPRDARAPAAQLRAELRRLPEPFPHMVRSTLPREPAPVLARWVARLGGYARARLAAALRRR